MKTSHVAAISILALTVGIVVGRLSAPVNAKIQGTPEAPSSVSSTQVVSDSFESADETARKRTIKEPLPSNALADLNPKAPDFTYDRSIPFTRTVGETVMAVRAESWRNTGRATLADALQTQFWAIAGGDVPSLAEGIILDEPAKEIIMKMMTNAPATVRSEYDSPERFAALLVASNFHGLRAFTLDRQRPLSESESITTFSTVSEGQDRPQTHFARFRKASDGTWLRVIDSKAATSMVLAHVLGESPK